MRLTRFCILALVAALSITVNAVLLVELRSRYIDGKILAARPYNARVFAEENASLARNPAGRRRVLLFGDSRIAEWRPEPEFEGSFELINRGIVGETTEQMRLRFRNDVLALNPDVVVIQAGINDLVAASLAPPQIRHDLVKQCIENLAAFAQKGSDNNIYVVLLTILPPAPPPLYRWFVFDRSIWALVEEVNDSLDQLAIASRISVVDSGKALLKLDGTWHDGVSRDTLHLTDEGYERLNSRIAPVLNRLLADAVP